ncbi:PfkB family carbohydrate kinase [Pelagibius sp. 7325]|uniref:PfkB family carbohydrate kinase n=1 Tax=Pelagibius sp. 7325 TaxID=3131994 RepID=UPI0030EC0D6C
MDTEARGAAKPRIAAVGACHLDRKARAAAPFAVGASNPVVLGGCPGGVARNVAENLCRLGADVRLVTRLGNDPEGDTLMAGLRGLPPDLPAIDLTGVSRSADAPTAFHLIALQPDGEMLVAVADMRIYDEITPAVLRGLPAGLWDVDAIFADCNLPAETLGFLAALRGESRRLAVNGVSPAKAVRLGPSLAACDLLFVNRGEAAALLGVKVEELDPAAAAAALRRAGAGEVAMTLGGEGLCVATEKETLMLENLDNRVVDITGAGDALAAAYLEARLRGVPPAAAGRRALAAAHLTVACEESVNPALSPAALDRLVTA